jgi:hypothetical protein
VPAIDTGVAGKSAFLLTEVVGYFRAARIHEPFVLGGAICVMAQEAHRFA